MAQTGDTFTPFYGEFLVSPIPLELSFNYCSAACAYCFANLNKRNRRADIPATMNMLATYRERSTLTATLLQQGYPVLVSNRVDPFAVSNYRQFLPVLEVMCELGVPVAIQTKGGRGIDKALDLLKTPTVFYITIESDQDELVKKIAPGAPSITERLELIALLRSKGHQVVVGWNPCVPEWCKDEEAQLDRLKAAGVHGVWLQELHLNSNQTRKLKPKEIEALDPKLIKRASGKKADPTDVDYVNWVADEACERGLNPFVMNQCRRSDFFAPFHECYEKTFPTMQDFVNACCDYLEPGAILTVDDFVDWLSPSMPAGAHQTGHYICSTNYNLCMTIANEDGEKWDHKKTYADILRMAWQDSRIKFSPGRNLGLQYAVTPEGEDWVDENGYPVLVWNGNPSLEWNKIVKDL
jgi:DNA repair photolyase